MAGSMLIYTPWIVPEINAFLVDLVPAPFLLYPILKKTALPLRFFQVLLDGHIIHSVASATMAHDLVKAIFPIFNENWSATTGRRLAQNQLSENFR